MIHLWDETKSEKFSLFDYWLTGRLLAILWGRQTVGWCLSQSKEPSLFGPRNLPPLSVCPWFLPLVVGAADPGRERAPVGPDGWWGLPLATKVKVKTLLTSPVRPGPEFGAGVGG